MRGGVLYYNTTDSGDVQLTGVTEFPYALRVVNFLAVSDSPILVDKDRWRNALFNYRIEGRPVFDFSRARDRERFEEILGLADTLDGRQPKEPMTMEYAEHLRARIHGARVITDDNMGTEWRGPQ